MIKNKILISKDILRTDYLSCYGSKYWNTPNIDKLAKKGTIFKNHYTASPSTSMSITAMFTGIYPYQLKRKKYIEVEEFDQEETLWDKLRKKGYTNFVIWPFEWREKAWKYSKVFPKETTVNNLEGINQPIIQHIRKSKKIQIDKEKSERSIELILRVINNCLEHKDPIFIWLHLPHVLIGRNGYGSDIDLFDKLVREINGKFDEDSIYITADHGHMNCEKGIPVYGFHVYEGSVRIPLITPKIMGKNEINFPTSNIQLMDIILYGKIKKLKYIYSDTQYYLQDNRKFCIIKDNYKYIYNKRNKSEELYDLEYDPTESVNLLTEHWNERNREGSYYLEEIYYYPEWEKAKEVYLQLRSEKNKIWREGSWIIESLHKLNNIRKRGLSNIKNIFARKNTSKGRWNSRVQIIFYEK